ncbi:MAG: hypothetical protein AAAB35_27625 [Phyllobacterium sp.]
MKDKRLETAVYVCEIATEDTTLVVDIYTRDPHNAHQTLLDLKAAIDALLEEWNPGDYTQTKEPHVYHSGVMWPLHISRPAATNRVLEATDAETR